MPDHNYVFQVTAPGNTPASAPVEVPTMLDPGIVERIEIRWPVGHSSLTGLRIAAAHQPVIPKNPGGWILGDGVARSYQLTNMPQGGQWSAFVYNVDYRPHYWQVTFEVAELELEQAFAMRDASPIPHVEIYAAASRLGTHR